MQPLSNKKRRSYFYLFVLLFLGMIPVIVLHVQGYRLDNNFSIVRVGGLYIGEVDSDVEVFLDDVLQENMKELKRGFFVEDLYPARYSVLVKKDGFVSWGKDVIVRAEKVSEVYPLIMSSKVEAHEIPAQVEGTRGFFDPKSSTKLVTNDVFVDTLKLFTKETDSGFITRRGVTLWHDDAHVYYVWKGGGVTSAPVFCGDHDCTATSTVYTALEKISRADFLPGRNDVVLVALPSGIYAVEMDGRYPQHSIQMYYGKNADFRVEDGETLYVKDGQKLFQIDI